VARVVRDRAEMGIERGRGKGEVCSAAG